MDVVYALLALISASVSRAGRDSKGIQIVLGARGFLIFPRPSTNGTTNFFLRRTQCDQMRLSPQDNIAYLAIASDSVPANALLNEV